VGGRVAAGSPPRYGGHVKARPAPSEIRIGVSSCLLGEKVRFDGGHKRDAFVMGSLGRFVTFVPVCPEVEVGMGTPREAVRLVRLGETVHLVAPKSGTDWTRAMEAWSARRAAEIERERLSGYVLKKDSPSCGMERVRVYGSKGMAVKAGRGLFAAALLDRFPLLPVEEEGRLGDPALRESFVERIFAYQRQRALFAGSWSVGDLVRFHTAEKLLLLAHEPAAYQALGRLVAAAKRTPRTELARRYAEAFMKALARPATKGKHANVLQHMAGYFKGLLAAEDGRELHEAIADYQRGLLPLVVPVTLVRHHVRRHDVAYLAGQSYLEPHPKELMLRNHV
jgi:uncharacterized protein YbgA (DUF1722 family)/uncharacterized protein YbbK (DUF523 family)